MEVFLEVILPVFLVIGTGYLSVWRKWLNAKNMLILPLEKLRLCE